MKADLEWVNHGIFTYLENSEKHVSTPRPGNTFGAFRCFPPDLADDVNGPHTL